jgi:hypothetical protein
MESELRYHEIRQQLIGVQLEDDYKVGSAG